MVSLSNPRAKIFVKNAAKSKTTKVKKSIKIVNLVKTEAAKIPFFLAWAKLGINACVKEPSPKSLRNKFGSLNATKNISLQIPAPSTEAVIRSRTKPKMRETKIPKLFVKKPLNIPIRKVFIKYKGKL